METKGTMPSEAGKAFYLFMCSILGALLFVVLQRALALIYLLILNNDYNRFSFGLTDQSLTVINYSSLVLALIFGLWYGVWLGLHWYRIVYEQGHGGLFHGFKGHWLHNEGVISKPTKPATPVAKPIAPVIKSTPPVKIAAAPAKTPDPQVITIKPVAQLDDDGEPKGVWEFDDLLDAKRAAAKPVPAFVVRTIAAKPVVAKLPAAKTAAKKAKALGKPLAKASPAKKTTITTSTPKSAAKAAAKRRPAKKTPAKFA